MKKKFISLLIIANIILQIFPVYAANVKVNYEEAENVLCALGIYDEKPSGEYVSRSEFFAHFMKALGMSADESNSVALADTTLTGLTALSYNMGYSALFSDNKFHPEKSVTVEEYVKAAIKALNCELALSDGSTNSYMRLAAELELLRGISKSADEAITYEEESVLLYRMMTAPMMVVGENLNKYEFDDNATILSNIFDVYYDKGIITGTKYSRLASESGTGSNTVEINNTQYTVTDEQINKYLGYNVGYHYRDTDGELEIICYICEGYSEDFILYSDEIDQFKNNEYTYVLKGDNNKVKTADVEADADILYNGAAMIGTPDYTPQEGYVLLIDNDTDGIYDVVSIYDKTTIVYGLYDTNKNVFRDKYSSTAVQIDPSNSSKYLTIHDNKNNSVEISDILQGSVLEIYQSKNGKMTDILVYKNSIVGRIEGVEDVGEKRYYTINSVEYAMLSGFADYMTSKGLKINVGETYEFILDSRGNIADYKTATESSAEASTEGYGYLITTYMAAENEDSGIFTVKYLNASGKVVEALSANRVKLDGESLKSRNAYTKVRDIVFTAGKKTPTIMYYKTNSGSEITFIDTPTKTTAEGNNSIVKKGETLTGEYVEKVNTLANTICNVINFKSETPVFVVPSDPDTASDDQYAMQSAAGYLKHYKQGIYRGYSRSVSGVFSDVIVSVDTLGLDIDGKSAPCMVQNIMTGVNFDNEAVYMLELLSKDGTKTISLSKNDVLKTTTALGAEITIAEGDVVRYTTNFYGDISALQFIYRPETDTLRYDVNPTGSGVPTKRPSGDISKYFTYKSDFSSSGRFYLANVYYKDGEYIRVVNPIFDLKDKNICAEIENGNITVENFKAQNVFIYDKDGKVPYRQGTANEIYDYYGMNKASKVLVMTNDAVVQTVIVFNN